MRVIGFVLWVLLGWPVAVVRALAARRRLQRQRQREELDFAVERVA